MSSEKLKLLKKIVVFTIIFIPLCSILKYFSAVKPAEPELPPVEVSKPILTPITNYVTQTGTMVAYNSVNLVARIEGYLEKIEFVDGTFVKKDKELFVIEPEPYLEKLKEAEASVTVQKALYAYNTSEFKRQQLMYKQNATSLNNVEKWQAETERTKGEIDKAIANKIDAEINYSYTHVLAPFDGRIGRHLVDTGNLVGNGKATNLATIEQIDPIYVYFNLSELDLIKVREAARANNFKPKDLETLPVFVRMQNETEFLHKGHLNFVNTGLNASTGTMEFRALLTNKDLNLLPGLFVEVRIPISLPKPQLTIPDTSVLYDQIGPYILVLNKNDEVMVKRIVLGGLEQGMRAITKGLLADERVVISGLQNAIPGHRVAPLKNNKV